ncbi:MAG: hemerythrin domain-containing protein [Planctomycetes bacterium]|nr:hemerythrin domain-containing protein [Planctomycetota bacterium]
MADIDPIALLGAEHRLILQVTACIEAMGAVAARTGHVNEAAAGAAVEFMRTYADRCHHGKEEDLLFSALDALGAHGLDLAGLGEEHVRGRKLAAASARAVAADNGAAFARAADGYVELIRTHIAREEAGLLPRAGELLDAEARAELARRFAVVAADTLGEETHARMIARANALAERYGVARADADPAVRALLFAHAGCRPGEEERALQPPPAHLAHLPAAWRGRPLGELERHLRAHHHQDVLTTLDLLLPIADKVAGQHGPTHPGLGRLGGELLAFRADFQAHIIDEEERVFPAAGGIQPPDRAAVSASLREHAALGERMARIRACCDGYQPWEGCSGNLRTLYHGLESVDHRLGETVHLEQDVLFPRLLSGLV